MGPGSQLLGLAVRQYQVGSSSTATDARAGAFLIGRGGNAVGEVVVSHSVRGEKPAFTKVPSTMRVGRTGRLLLSANNALNLPVASVAPLAGLPFEPSGRCAQQASRRPAAFAAAATAG